MIAVRNKENEIYGYDPLGITYTLDIQSKAIVFVLPVCRWLKEGKDEWSMKKTGDTDYDSVTIVNIKNMVWRAAIEFNLEMRDYFLENPGRKVCKFLEPNVVREGSLSVSLSYREESADNLDENSIYLSGSVSYCRDSVDDFSILDFNLDLVNKKVQSLRTDIKAVEESLGPLLNLIAGELREKLGIKKDSKNMIAVD